MRVSGALRREGPGSLWRPPPRAPAASGARSPPERPRTPAAGLAPGLVTPHFKPLRLSRFTSLEQQFSAVKLIPLFFAKSGAYPALYKWPEKMLAVSTAKSLTSEFKVQKRLHDASLLFQLLLF